jgi:hypothetical protein
MRRIKILPALTVAAFALMAQPALATFHLEMVNEVMLASSSGDSGVQFVELLDNGGSEETFTPVFAPYKLVVYDADGHKLGEQTLSASGLRSAAGSDSEYLISTAAADGAFGVTGDERLTVTLPAGAGQACYEANQSPSAFSCMTWGTITKAVATNSNGTGTVKGPVPPNGESDQRQSDGSVVAADPTPKAKNRATSSSPGGGGGGTGGGGGGGGGSATFSGVAFAAHSAPVSRSGQALVPLSCPSGSGGCTGKLTLTLVKTGARTTKLGSAAFTLAAGKTGKVHVKLSRRGKRLLARRHKLKVHAVVDAHDSSGQSKRTTATITLKARSHR